MAQTPRPPVIAMRHVTKKFGTTTALNGVSFEVGQGHIHGFLGPNGAGKTTIIRIIMDFLRPTKGEIELFGQDSHKQSTRLKHTIGYLSGDFELYENLTGHHYLTYIARLRGHKNYKHLAKLCNDLDVNLKRKIGLLSRGNKQKIGLLAALIDDPDLLILDEPTTGLDPLMQQKFYQVIRSYARRDKTVFMSSHILSGVQEVCDVITFMKQGEVIETVNVRDVLQASRRRITLAYAPRATILDPPPRLGMAMIAKTLHHRVFEVDTMTQPVLRWIASQSLTDATITEIGLEEIFMDMYRERAVSDV